ncbi:hypothetical protein [Sessilibacter sp. MAH2]
MSMIHIKPELLHALNEIQGESFTVAELTTHYLEHPESLHKGKKPARQFIYRNIVRMINTGFMEKLPDNGGWPKYRLTQKFRSHRSGLTEKEALTSLPSKPNTSVKIQSAPPSKPITALRERLNKHRSDMLCALGEAEEYESLCKELLELSEEAQALYSEARERSALLLGKIKALESLLSSRGSRK